MHHGEIPRAGCDGGGLGALGGAGAAADDGGGAGGERLVEGLRHQEVDMGVDGSGREDAALAGDHVGAGADHQIRVHAVADVGVAGTAEGDDPPVADADVGLDDAPVVQDDRVGDDQVGCALGTGRGGLGHRLADGLAAPEDGFVAAEAAVLLDLDPEIGVGEADPVPGGGAVERGVGGAGQLGHVTRSSVRGVGAAGADVRVPGSTMPGTRRRPRSSTRLTSTPTPGSKRSDVPEGISSRNPRAAARSKESAGFASEKCRCDPT